MYPTYEELFHKVLTVEEQLAVRKNAVMEEGWAFHRTYEEVRKEDSSITEEEYETFCQDMTNDIPF